MVKVYILYILYVFHISFINYIKWFHPGSNRGPSLRESDVITNYTMKPTNSRVKRISCRYQGGLSMTIHYGVVGNIQASHVCAPGSIPGDGVFLLERVMKGLSQLR